MYDNPINTIQETTQAIPKTSIYLLAEFHFKVSKYKIIPIQIIPIAIYLKYFGNIYYN